MGSADTASEARKASQINALGLEGRPIGRDRSCRPTTRIGFDATRRSPEASRSSKDSSEAAYGTGDPVVGGTSCEPLVSTSRALLSSSRVAPVVATLLSRCHFGRKARLFRDGARDLVWRRFRRVVRNRGFAFAKVDLRGCNPYGFHGGSLHTGGAGASSHPLHFESAECGFRFRFLQRLGSSAGAKHAQNANDHRDPCPHDCLAKRSG